MKNTTAKDVWNVKVMVNHEKKTGCALLGNGEPYQISAIQNFNCSRDVEPKTKLSLVWFSLKVFHWFSPLALITKLNGKQLWNIEELCQINKWCLPWSHCNFCRGAKIDATGYKTPKEQSHCVKIYKSPKTKPGFVVNFKLFGKVKMFVAWAIFF